MEFCQRRNLYSEVRAVIGPSCRFTETPPGPDFLGHHAVETFLHAGQALEALIVIAVCDVMASAYRWATLTVLDTCVGSLGFLDVSTLTLQ